MDTKLKHLEFIQDVITRMANNSFLLKGWSVVLISALFALSAKDKEPVLLYLAYFPALAFWVLDGYFLHQERLFRALYDQVRVKDEADIDFAMSTAGVIDRVDSWAAVTLSRTLLLFHGPIVLAIVVVMLLLPHLQ